MIVFWEMLQAYMDFSDITDRRGSRGKSSRTKHCYERTAQLNRVKRVLSALRFLLLVAQVYLSTRLQPQPNELIMGLNRGPVFVKTKNKASAI